MVASVPPPPVVGALEVDTLTLLSVPAVVVAGASDKTPLPVPGLPMEFVADVLSDGESEWVRVHAPLSIPTKAPTRQAPRRIEMLSMA